MKKFVWTALVTVVSATAAALAVRGLDYVWRQLVKEPPPKPPRWARLVVGNPLKKRVEHRVQPGSA